MVRIAELLNAFATRALRLWTRPEQLAVFAVLGIALLIWAVALRRRRGAWPSRTNAATDAVYAAFYTGRFYSLFIGVPLAAALRHVLPETLHPLAPLATWLQFAIVFVAMDLTNYAWHRLAHGLPWLWMFHRVHHSQTELTPLTTYRFHIGDEITRGTLLAIAAALFGVTTPVYLAAICVQTAANAFGHADLDWTFGPLGRLFVSPQFHRVHHSAEARHAGRNFGSLFSAWDYLFGTADESAERPRAYGIEGETVARGFIAQQVEPLATALRRLKPVAPPAGAPPAVATPGDLDR